MDALVNSPPGRIKTKAMSLEPRRALIVEGCEVTGSQVQHVLQEDLGLAVDRHREPEAALEALERDHYSLLVLPLRGGPLDALAFLEAAHARNYFVPAIVYARRELVADAVRALHLGARDVLPDPPARDRLRRAVERALDETALEDELDRTRRKLQARFRVADVVGKGPRMQAVFDLIEQTAPTGATVLLEGETGTGKELIARAIHLASPRRDGPLVAVNCAAVPDGLLASELFGHEAGAFTGASGRQLGRFELADQGTLFLDEVGDVPGPMQAALLRALQERRFERVGSVESIEVDVRVIAASNRPLQRLVRQGKFREDLFYRLNVVRIDLPPLRERPEDVPLLAMHFARKHARGHGPVPRLADQTLDALRAHVWPGNVRELENALERACLTARGGVILPDDLALAATLQAVSWPAERIDLERTLPDLLAEAARDVESHYLRKVFRKCKGNLHRCARVCGLSRRWVATKLAEYGINTAQPAES